MSSVEAHLRDIDGVICNNIAVLSDDRALLSQNMLAQLRNLVEGVAVLIHTKDRSTEHDYDAITAGLAFMKTQGKLGFLNRFYRLLQPSASHYTFDGDGSERLMLKYYEYLHRVRDILSKTFGLDVLHNLEDFPVDLDPALREYHQKIAERVEAAHGVPSRSDRSSRYYVLKTRPFFTGGRIYYEVTFAIPSDRPSISKFDHVIAFTEHDISDKHAASLTLRSDAIEVLGQRMPIMLITAWEVSIRGCEFANFSRFFGPRSRVSTTSNEYKNLMHYLTRTGSTLLDVVDLPDADYDRIKAWVLADTKTPSIYPTLDESRRIIRDRRPGYLLLRYLLLSMRNVVIRKQYNKDVCGKLSNLHLQWGCIPFEQMPFCTYPMGHRTRFWDLLEAIDPTDRAHEMLARRSTTMSIAAACFTRLCPSSRTSATMSCRSSTSTTRCCTTVRDIRLVGWKSRTVTSSSVATKTTSSRSSRSCKATPPVAWGDGNRHSRSGWTGSRPRLTIPRRLPR